MTGRVSSASHRRSVAVESFRTATDCIGKIEKGMSLFAITRGQFSMIDAILACLDQAGPAELSLWTWTVAEYEVQCVERLRNDSRITKASLIIDRGARNKNATIIEGWKAIFGPESVKYTLNHAKIATISNEEFRLLIRGSMNLNFNPKFEQLDITEGGPDFDLVREIESELPWCGDNPTQAQLYKSSRVSGAFDAEQLEMFKGLKAWKK
jgi:hypothetical protein